MHGVYATYRHGCRCLPCKAASARLRAQQWRDRKLGRLRLGSIVSPQEAMKRIKQMQAEKVIISRELGLRNRARTARLHPSGVTVRRLLRIRRLYRLKMAEDISGEKSA